MKRYTNKKAGKFFNKVLSGVTADYAVLHNSWSDNFGRWFACDGYRAYRVNTMPDGLLETWSVHILPKAKVEAVHSAVEAMFDGDKLEQIEEISIDFETVMDAYRNSEDWTIDLGEDYPVVNVKYLREAMEMLPGGKVYCTDNMKRMISPVYVISDDGIALILPIRRESKFHWNYNSRKGA